MHVPSFAFFTAFPRFCEGSEGQQARCVRTARSQARLGRGRAAAGGPVHNRAPLTGCLPWFLAAADTNALIVALEQNTIAAVGMDV